MYNLLYSANDRNAGTFLGYQILSTQNLSQSFGHFKFAPYHHSIIAQITITKTKIIWISSFSCNYAVLVAEKWHPGRKNCVSWWAQVIPHRGTVLGNKMNILLLLPSLYQQEQQRVTPPPPSLMDQWYPSKSIQHLSFCSVHLLFCVGHLVDWFGWSRSKNWSSWWVWNSHNVRPSVLPFLPRLPCGPYFLSEATLWA